MPTLHLTIYFEVLPMQTGIHSQEYHLVFSQLSLSYVVPTAMIYYTIANFSHSRYNLNVHTLCDDCRYVSLRTEQLLRKVHPTLTVKTLYGFSTFGHLSVNNYLPSSRFTGWRKKRIYDSTDSLSMHEQLLKPNYRHDINMYSLLLTGPRNLLRPLCGTLVHTSETGPSLVEIRVWTIHGPQFVKGQFQFEQLSVEIQREKCSVEDTVMVYDGPPGGMLTANGLVSLFGVLYGGPCANITDVIRSSLGDVTIFWVWHNTEKRNVSFTYNQQPVLCSQISCTYANISVTGMEETVTFKQSDRPSFQIFRFEASNGGNVQLRFQMHRADYLYSIEGCLYSALWLFEDSIRGVFCTQSTSCF